MQDKIKKSEPKEIDRYVLTDKDGRSDVDYDEYIRRREGDGRVIRKVLRDED